MDTPTNLTPRRLAHSINETAELLAVTRRTIYRRIARGELRPVRCSPSVSSLRGCGSESQDGLQLLCIGLRAEL